jgi:hypothetical protein
MGKKFDKIFEAVVSRYQVGGYLPGDIVKFRANYKSTPTYKAMHSEMQRELDELANSGLNIKVTQVGSKTYNQSAANDHKTADNVVITIAGDHGGGRYYNSITVSPEMIDIVGAGDPTPQVASQFYRDDEKYLNGKTEEWKADQQNITRVTDKGNGKNTPTDLKLAGESTRLKRDNENMVSLYEKVNEVNFQPIYESVMLDEGFLRRMATKFAGGFKSNPLQSQNKIHQFAKSIALDAGKDISKSFGGNFNTHANNLYTHILEYLKTQATNP